MDHVIGRWSSTSYDLTSWNDGTRVLTERATGHSAFEAGDESGALYRQWHRKYLQERWAEPPPAHPE